MLQGVFLYSSRGKNADFSLMILYSDKLPKFSDILCKPGSDLDYFFAKIKKEDFWLEGYWYRLENENPYKNERWYSVWE